MAYQKMHHLLELAIRIQSDTEGVAIADICQQFGISRRTAERMLEFLRQKFPQLSETTGEKGIKRWRLPSGTLKNYINFSADEISALQNALRLTEQAQLEGQSRLLTSILHKLKALMEPETLYRIEADTDIMNVSEGYAFRPLRRLNINPRHVDLLRHAVTACRKVRIRYNSASGNRNWRTLHPYAFIYDKKHYLIAYAEKNRDFRCFNLENILELKESNDYFIRRPDFDLQKYCSENFGVFRDTPFEVEWLFDASGAAKAKSYIFHPGQTMTENADGSLTVCFKAGGILEMDRHLYSWGKHVRVIKPQNWQQMVEEVKQHV